MDPKDLLIRVLKGNATRKQRNELEQWLNSLDLKNATARNCQELPSPTKEDLYAIRELVLTNFKAQRKRRFIMLGLVMTVVIAIGASLTFLNTKPPVLVFQNATLAQIIPTIESTYSVTIVADPVILPCTFTGEFHGVQSAREAVSVLSTALHLQYHEKEDVYFEIWGNPCN
jgi:ferric-dicitrate binding protein FerR (iron transport regulator)